MYIKHPLYRLLALALFVVSLQCSKSNEGKVVAIKDGDTIEILINNTPVRVRLFGIDCPEKAQAYGSRAREYTSQLAFGKIVRLKEHGKDRYGRIIGEVFLPDGRSLNEEILKAGYAWVYRQYTRDMELVEYENKARQAKLGLWNDPSPTAPWEFRRNGGRKNESSKGSSYSRAEKDYGQCIAITKKGTRCKRKAVSPSGYCRLHSRDL